MYNPSDEAFKELEKLRKSHGGILRPGDVVDFAGEPTTALHSRFCWDDTLAAHKFRLWQAHEVIRLCVTVEPNTSRPMRVYVSLTPDRQEDNPGYRRVDAVIQNEGLRSIMLSDAKAEMERFIAKYQQFEELAKVIAAMKRTSDKLKLAKVS